MAEDVGSVYSEVRVKLDNLETDIKAVIGKLETIGKKGDETQKKLDGFAKLKDTFQKAFAPLAAATVAIGAITAAVTKAWNEMNRWTQAAEAFGAETNKLSAVLNSTGAAAWTTEKQLEQYAITMSHATNNSAEDIMRMQGVLLGFKSVTGDTFTRATTAIMDITAVMGGDLAGAANTVGKALDSPVQGMSALSRQGFIFTEQEKEMIRTLEEAGNHLEAQNIILNAMENAFKGAAVAMNDAAAITNSLAAAQKELDIEKGRTVGGFVNWWKELRLGMIEARVEQLKFVNDTNLIAANKGKIDEYSDSIAKLKDKLGINQEETFFGKTQKQLEELINSFPGLENEFRELVALEKQRQALSDNTAETELENSKRHLAALEAERDQAIQNSIQIDAANDVVVQAKEKEIKKITETISALEEEKKKIVERQEAAGEEIRRLETVTAQTNALNEAEKKVDAATKKRKETVLLLDAAIERGRITKEAANDRLLSAYSAEADALQNLKFLSEELAATQPESLEVRDRLQKKVNASLDDAIAKERQYQALTDKKNGAMSEKEFMAERERINNEFKKQLDFQAGLLDVHIIKEEDYNKRIIQARQSQVSALENLMQKAGATAEEYPKTFAIFDEALNGADNSLRTLQETNKRISNDDSLKESMRQWGKELEFIGTTTRDVARIEHERYIQNIQNQISQGEVSKDIGEAAIALNEQLFKSQSAQALIDEITKYDQKLDKVNSRTREGIAAQREKALAEAKIFDDGSKEYDKLIAKINEYYDALEKQEAWKRFARTAQTYLQSISQMMGNIGQAITAVMQKQTQDYVKELETRRDEQFRIWDEEMQERLYQMGLAEAVTEEQHQRDLEAAIESGDQRSIFEAEEALRRFEVEQEYADKKAELEKEVARQKADAEYRAALATWYIQCAQATASIAQAIIMASINFWPIPAIPMMVMAGAAGAAQMVALTAAKPVKQYATGGIVPGDSLTGDKMLGALNSKEMILNMDAQKNLFNAINSGDLGNGKAQQVVIPISLDGRPIAKVVVDLINDRQYLIKQASVV